MRYLLPYANAREVGLLTLLLALQAGLLWFSANRDAYFPGPVLRVAAPAQETAVSSLSPYGPGLQHDLVERFAASAGLEVVWTSVETWAEAFALLDDGQADLVLTRSVSAPPQAENFRHGPVLTESPLTLLHHAGRYSFSAPSRLCDAEVLYQGAPGLPADPRELLPPEQTQVATVVAGEGECRLAAMPMDQARLSPLLDQLSASDDALGVADVRLFNLWQPLYPDLVADMTLAGRVATRWHWTGRRPALANALESFLSSEETRQTLARLEDRYFGFFPRRTNFYELGYLKRVIRDRLPKYTDTILEAARANEIDPLLLVAVIHQESRFRSRARSHTGVRGIMQLNLDTARYLGIKNRLDPHQSIRGGARYLRLLNDRLSKKVTDPWERWFLTLAAYNQGFGGVTDAMQLAEEQGFDPALWSGVRQALPLLMRKKYYSKARHGYTRGAEAVRYVEKIRYYYYILSAFVAIPGREADQLAAFSAAPGGWPGPGAVVVPPVSGVDVLADAGS